MATTLRLSIKVAPCNVSEQKADGESSVGFQKKKKKSDARKNRGICECDFLTLPFFSLTVFPCFCICAFVCFSCSYGQFWGRWTRSVGLSGRGRRYPGAAHSQLPPTASYLVQGRAQNPTQQSHVSTLFPFVSFCALYLFYMCLILWILFSALFVPGGALVWECLFPPVACHSSHYILC